MPGGLALGWTVSMAVTLAGAMGAAYLISGETIAETSVGYCSMVILLTASVLGPLVAAGRIKHRRVFVCAVSGLIYYATLLAVTALFFGGQYQGMGVTGLLVFGGCAAVILLGLRQGRRGSARKRKIGR